MTDEGSRDVIKEKYWSQYMTVLSATLVSVMAGINFAWSSPSTPQLRSASHLPRPLSAEECSYIALISPVGDIVGAPISAYLVDRIGRKRVILMTAIPQTVSFLLLYVATAGILEGETTWLLYVGRFLGGMAEGSNFTMTAIYIGEIVSPRVRGNLGSYMSLTLRMGILFINVVGTQLPISTTSLVSLAIPTLFFLTFVWMPESPYYLLMEGRRDEAASALRFLRRRDDVQEELNKIGEAVERQVQEPGTFSDLFTVPSNRKAFLINIVLRTFQQLSGISAFTLYTQTFFSQSLSSLPSDQATIIYATVQLLTTFMSTLLADKAGRKPLLVFSCCSCVVVLACMAVYFTLTEYTKVDVSGVAWVPMAGMLVFIVVFAIGLGTIVNTLLGEMFPQKVKAKALCLLNIHFAVMMSITTKFFQVMLTSVGLAIPFYAFSANCLLGAFFCYYCVPETKNKTLEEVQQKLKRGRKRREQVEENEKETDNEKTVSITYIGMTGLEL